MPERYNPLITQFRTRQSELDDLFVLLDSNGHMNEIERSTYMKPGQSIKYKISMVSHAVTRNISEIQKHSSYNNKDLAFMSEIIMRELRLLECVQQPKNLRCILKDSGLPCPDLLEVTRIPARISFPFIVRPKEPKEHDGRNSYFIRYSGLIGDLYVNRYDPREVVFQQLMAETVLREFISDDLIVSTLFPSIDTATNLRHAEASSGDTLEEIRQRLIIQPDHSQDWHLLIEHNDLVEIAELFGRLIGIVHASTWGQNLKPTGAARRFFNEFRDQTFNQYEHWLREKNWIPQMYLALKKTTQQEQSPRAKALKSVQNELDNIWDRCVVRSVLFWKNGAVLVPPDINPRNIFVNSDRSLKMFDFDNILVLDPSYHVGRSLHILLHTANQMDIWDVKLTMESIDSFRSSYAETLRSKNAGFSSDDEAFRSNMSGYAALNYISYYLSSAEALSLKRGQIEAILTVGRSILSS